MDTARAHRITSEIIGQEVGGWRPDEYLGHGKSALVLRATCGDQRAALKIFDPELVERFGAIAQMERLKRETSLIGHGHPNLIEILDGGRCNQTDYLYIVMEFLGDEWVCLGDRIEDFPRDHIWRVIEGISKAARFLESRELAHRDIKPDNIMVTSDFGTAKLLDLGILRPIGMDGLTDDERKTFIGTSKYSSPEFLLREEKDSIEGWRALSLYQLGGVLHDLIMRKPLFEEFSDLQARLMEAVRNDKPTIEADDVDADLILLCENCLVKDPDLRLKLTNWDSFSFVQSEKREEAERVRMRVKQRRIQATESRAAHETEEANEQLAQARRRELHDIEEAVRSIIRLICIGNEDFPHITFCDVESTDQSCKRFFITLTPSVQLSLRSYVAVSYTINLLDVSEMVIELTRRYTITETHPKATDFNDDGEILLHRGVFEEVNIKTQMRDDLYSIVDGAQRN